MQSSRSWSFRSIDALEYYRISHFKKLSFTISIHNDTYVICSISTCTGIFTWPVINSLPTSWVEWLIIFYQTINPWKIWLVIIESPLWALRYCGWWTIRCSGSTRTSRTRTKVFPIESIEVPILVFITNIGATLPLQNCGEELVLYPMIGFCCCFCHKVCIIEWVG